MSSLCFIVKDINLTVLYFVTEDTKVVVRLIEDTKLGASVRGNTTLAHCILQEGIRS